jgi:hypothetical protein
MIETHRKDKHSMNINSTSITRRRFIGDSVLAATIAASPLPALAQENETASVVTQPARSLITVGVVQQAREPELAANRDKIVRFIGQAKARGCRLVIFPEDALGCPVGTSNDDMEKAVDAIGDAARSNDVYVLQSVKFLFFLHVFQGVKSFSGSYAARAFCRLQ